MVYEICTDCVAVYSRTSALAQKRAENPEILNLNPRTDLSRRPQPGACARFKAEDAIVSCFHHCLKLIMDVIDGYIRPMKVALNVSAASPVYQASAPAGRRSVSCFL